MPLDSSFLQITLLLCYDIFCARSNFLRAKTTFDQTFDTTFDEHILYSTYFTYYIGITKLFKF